MPLVSQRATPTASASFTAREGCLRTRLPLLVWFAGACSLMVICIFDDEGLALTACTLVLTAAPACIFDTTYKSSSPAVLRVSSTCAALFVSVSSTVHRRLCGSALRTSSHKV